MGEVFPNLLLRILEEVLIRLGFEKVHLQAREVHPIFLLGTTLESILSHLKVLRGVGEMMVQVYCL